MAFDLEQRRKERREKDYQDWHYRDTKLGLFLIEQLENKKPAKNWFDAWNDISAEQFNHVASFASRIVRWLELVESINGDSDGVRLYQYSYNDTVLFQVNVHNGGYTLEFPCMNEILGTDQIKRYADNPLLPFLAFYACFDTHIYGPAQGLYGLYYQMLMGYMVYKYPETRSRFIKGREAHD